MPCQLACAFFPGRSITPLLPHHPTQDSSAVSKIKKTETTYFGDISIISQTKPTVPKRIKNHRKTHRTPSPYLILSPLCEYDSTTFLKNQVPEIKKYIFFWQGSVLHIILYYCLSKKLITLSLDCCFTTC